MKILVISRSPWRKDNSFGNTYSSIFSKLQDVQIAHISLADGVPTYEQNVTEYFIVPESEIKNSILNRKKVGYRLSQKDIDTNQNNKPISKISKSIPRLPIFYMCRDAIWKFGKLDIDGIIEFTKEFKPDILFVPLYYANYVSQIALFIHKALKIPMVLEASIDVYSLKQLSFDPFFWINRIIIRKTIRRIVKRASLLYVITDKMKKDYQALLSIPIKTLYKFPNALNAQEAYLPPSNQQLLYIYTGNIGGGRWKTLSAIAEAIKKNQKGILHIYTSTPISDKIRKALNIKGVSEIKGYIEASKIPFIQAKADVLVHCEPFDLKTRWNIRYSISTKIMDYLCAGRTILAVGPKDIASMEFLKDNDLAVYANDLKSISGILDKFSPQTLNKYANRGIEYIKTNYQLGSLQSEFISDLKKVILDSKNA